jgi:single-strand DNA-binding protein
MSYQKNIYIGNLGSDPEMRFLPNGTPVTNFNLATNRTYTHNGEKVKETTWLRISAWGRQAETCNQYLRRGAKVLVEGRLKPDPETGGPRIYQRQDGTYGASFEVDAEKVVFIDTRNAAESFADETGGTYEVGDDIPF